MAGMACSNKLRVKNLVIKSGCEKSTLSSGDESISTAHCYPILASNHTTIDDLLL